MQYQKYANLICRRIFIYFIFFGKRFWFFICFFFLAFLLPLIKPNDRFWYLVDSSRFI